MARPRTRRRIEIGWVEAIVLLFGYVLSLGVVGLGGIYVGQRAVQQRLGAKERIFRLPIDAGPGSPTPEVASDEPDITFYEKLGKNEPRAPAPEGRVILPGQAREPGPAAAAKPAAGPKAAGRPEPAAVPKSPDGFLGRGAASGADQGTGEVARLSPAARPAQPVTGAGAMPPVPAGAPKPAAERPQTEGQPRTGIAPSPRVGTPLPSPVENPLSGRRPPAPPSATDARDAANTIDDGEKRTGTPPAQPAARVTPEAAATARALLGSSAADPEQQVGTGSWSVQVNATQDRGVADRLVTDLRTRGYDAFIVTQTREGAVWYRVRVGRLPTLEKANALVGELKERAGLPHAFVASD